MRIGYPCINHSLSCRSSRTFRLRSYSAERFVRTVRGNLDCLRETLEYNLSHHIFFFRITSDLIPFASHPVCDVNWQREFGSQFSDIGNFITANNMRVSMHPDQFVLINSPDEGIWERSAKELQYHADVLDLLGLDPSAKIQIHVGGVYGDSEGSIERFLLRYGKLPDSVKRRLAVENDERLYDASDCLRIARAAGMPVIFDAFHFSVLNRGESLRGIFSEVRGTWRKKDGPPIVDYSSQEPGRRIGSHASSLDPRDFRIFLKSLKGYDFDLMLEIKDKERSALRAIREARQLDSRP